MLVYDHLGKLLIGLFATGVAVHFARRHHERLRYGALRAAYEAALRDARDSGADPAAIVYLTELHREFMRAWCPTWLDGFGLRLRFMAKLCAALALVALFLKAPLERRKASTKADNAALAAGAQPSGRIVRTR